MCLVVTTPDTGTNYLVDVGFGGIGPMAPVCVDTPAATQQVDGAYRVVPVSDDQPLLQGNHNNYRGVKLSDVMFPTCAFCVVMFVVALIFLHFCVAFSPAMAHAGQGHLDRSVLVP